MLSSAQPSFSSSNPYSLLGQQSVIPQQPLSSAILPEDRRPDPRPTAGDPGWHTKAQFMSMLGPRDGKKDGGRHGDQQAPSPRGAKRRHSVAVGDARAVRSDADREMRRNLEEDDTVQWYSKVRFDEYYGPAESKKQWRAAGQWMQRANLPQRPRGDLARF
eukprot:gene11732-biopygen4296